MFTLATYEVGIFTLFMTTNPAGQMPTFLSAWINRFSITQLPQIYNNDY